MAPVPARDLPQGMSEDELFITSDGWGPLRLLGIFLALYGTLQLFRFSGLEILGPLPSMCGGRGDAFPLDLPIIAVASLFAWELLRPNSSATRQGIRRRAARKYGCLSLQGGQLRLDWHPLADRPSLLIPHLDLLQLNTSQCRAILRVRCEFGYELRFKVRDFATLREAAQLRPSSKAKMVPLCAVGTAGIR